MVEPIPINSSWVKSIDYSGGLLTIVTAKGKRIVLIGVPPEIWEQFQSATSKGEFYNKNLKGKFKEL